MMSGSLTVALIELAKALTKLAEVTTTYVRNKYLTS